MAANAIIFLFKTTTLKKFQVLVDFLYFDSALNKINGETRFVSAYWLHVLQITETQKYLLKHEIMKIQNFIQKQATIEL